MKYIDLQAVKGTDAKIYSELLVSVVAGLLSGRDFFLSIFSFFSLIYSFFVFVLLSDSTTSCRKKRLIRNQF